MKMESLLSLRDAVRLLGVTNDVARPQANVDCPVCHGKKKLNLAFDKGTDGLGLFRCAKCGVSGRSLHLWALYNGLPLDDLKGAARHYHQFIGDTYGRSNVNREKITLPAANPVRIVDLPPASLEKRDATYRGLLAVSILSETHTVSLLNRGLTKEDIERNEYRSFPLRDGTEVAQKLLSMGCDLEGVPGFFLNQNGKWQLRKYTSGILIPQRSINGLIQGFQIRLDTKSKDGIRYLSLSSKDLVKGAPGKTYCHFRKGEKGYKEIILTEGALKGDVISSLSGYSILSVPGVNSRRYLPEALHILKGKGLQRVAVAFDMDALTNIHVQEALEKVRELLKRSHFEYYTLMWNPEYKGLDDYLLAKKNSPL